MSAPKTVEARVLPLELRDVGVQLAGRELLEVAGLLFEAGPPTVLLGPNGAGKTLLLRVCHGLLKPNRGRVTWRGRLAGEAAKHQAMVLQKPVLLRRSARANIDYALRVGGVSRDARQQRIEEVLRVAGLGEFADRPARRLSGGEQQRLVLARAWAQEPEVLFLDEPTAALDPGASFRVEKTISAIAEEGGKIIMATHDLGMAQRLAGEVIFLHQGKVVEHRDAEAFFAGPESREARAFLAGELTW